MMRLLTINQADCQQCGICADSCPIDIISMEDNGFPYVSEEGAQRCILCGHCEAVCTTLALKNNRLPEMPFIQQNKLQEINFENLSEYFRCRRSIRQFIPRAVEKSKLEKIFKTVNYSPTGVNQQQNKWIMICDSGIIRQLSSAVIEWMRTMVQAKADLAQFLGFETLIHSYEQGEDVICRDARNLVIGYTDAAYTGGIIDSVIATAHLELLLPSFGLGGCWAGFLMIALGYSQEVRKIVGLDESHAVRSALMIGYPKYRYSKVPYRKEAQVKWL